MEEALKRLLERRGSKVRRSFIFMYMMTPLKPNMKYKGILVFSLMTDVRSAHGENRNITYHKREERENTDGWLWWMMELAGNCWQWMRMLE